MAKSYLLYALLGIAFLICGGAFADDRLDVEYAQKLYNYRADQVFNNLRENTNNETIQLVLNELGASFCPGSTHKGFARRLDNGLWSRFNVSWTANDAGTVYGVDMIKGMYQFLGQNIFNNDSLHQVNIIGIKVTGNRATLTANIATWLNLRIDPSPAFFSLARGYYRNEFAKVRGQWCISKFEAYTLHQGNLAYDVSINYPFPFGMVNRI